MANDIIENHKRKWDGLALENDRYYVRSVDHEQSDEEFEQSGFESIQSHLLNDPHLRKKFMPFSERSILEIGCGSGRMTKSLAGTFKHVVAIDISKIMLDKAAAFVKRENVTYVESDGQNVPIAPESVDLAFSYIVYQHFPTTDAIFHSFDGVCRALKNNGLFKVQIRGIENSAKDHWAWGPHFARSDVDALALETGFHIIKTEGEGTRSFWLLLEKR